MTSAERIQRIVKNIEEDRDQLAIALWDILFAWPERDKDGHALEVAISRAQHVFLGSDGKAAVLQQRIQEKA